RWATAFAGLADFASRATLEATLRRRVLGDQRAGELRLHTRAAGRERSHRLLRRRERDRTLGARVSGAVLRGDGRTRPAGDADDLPGRGLLLRSRRGSVLSRPGERRRPLARRGPRRRSKERHLGAVQL